MCCIPHAMAPPRLSSVKIGIKVLMGIVLLALLVLSVMGTVAAVNYTRRKKPTKDEKIAACAAAVGGWIFSPFLSIVPIVMENNAAKVAKVD